MKCTQKAEKKLFLEGDLFMDGGKRASVRNIVISVLLIVVGIAMLMLVTEGIKSGWYDAHSARLRNEKAMRLYCQCFWFFWAALICTEGSEGRHFRWISAVCFPVIRTEVRLLSALRRAAAAGQFSAKSVAEGFLRFSDGKNRGIFSKKYDFLAADLVYRDCFVYNKVVWYVRLKESDCSIKEK